YSPANIKWKGCVEARIRPDDGSDHTEKAEDPPGIRLFRPYFYPESRLDPGDDRDNAWSMSTPQSEDADNNGGRGPNIGCADPIQPLTASKTTIQTAIDAMTVWNYGGTAIKLGLAWGWRAISPQWKGLWSAATPNLPLDYDEPNMDKAIILLTDGVQRFYSQSPGHPDRGYNSHGRIEWERLHDLDGPIDQPGEGEDELDRRLEILCEKVKEKGILLYTIVLQENDADLQNLFRNCASQPEYYFESPTSAQLEGIFETIANDLATLRIAE
ncbi:MAG TPA: hypothetical protein VLN73_03485, partial [Alphaproteobacteria bacterium]|nr:hypothetical protein [Alphaproteobacteria bacterium]